MQQWNLMVIGYPPPQHSAHWALRGPGVFLCSDFECFWTVQQEMETHHDHRALRAHIFWFCSTELNSPNSISLRLLFLFSMQVCSMCLVKLLLPTALSLISISFLRKRDWLGDPIAQCSRCQLKDAWIRASSDQSYMVNFVIRFPKIFVLSCSDLSNHEKYWFLWFSNSNFG